jgi:4'-phosphopantetheinyl transferase
LTNVPFNISHTGGLALLAISSRGRVGVDAESTALEADEIMSLAPEARLAAFFACWTRKEAFVKAIGKGLYVPIDQFRVTVRPDEVPRLVSMGWYESSTWSLADVGEEGVAATIAVDGPPPVIRRFDFRAGFN